MFDPELQAQIDDFYEGAIHGNDNALLKELFIQAHMVLGPIDRYEDAPLPPRILVGDLPDNLPITVTFPIGTKLVGSISDPNETGGDIYATVPQATEPVWEYLVRSFEKQGYHPLAEEEGYFMNLEFAAAFRIFCGPDPSVEILLTLYELYPDITNVRLSISSNSTGGPCSLGG